MGIQCWNSPDFKWWIVGWMPNGPVLEDHLNTKQLNHLKTKQMASILNFCFSKGRDNYLKTRYFVKMAAILFQMVRTQAIVLVQPFKN